jgi:ribosomal large subunit pseudouridine synthase D (EC 5.4.99.-)
MQRQALHAAVLRFVHPATRALQGFTAPIAADIQAQWQAFGGDPAALDPQPWHDDLAAA